ncbi:type II secretion system F family protein [Halobacteriovorax sp. GB3]|uniref:type II secretion system F family protein n=1 Tax=Halobacteriovorax sp. GB3 TaxID=2719615 RepID=UPI002360531B|nr:type II secretion system F family protein [Halobacteriovorax sp. GB3]MDD0854608.1 type II secretion system F family protein [Halobacteriovorax sp. GB3]
MANWRYEGLSKDGKRLEGAVDAKNEREARRILRAQGIRIKKITPPSLLEFDIGEWMEEKGFAKPFGMTELKNFTKQLSIMISAGVPILHGLEILYKSEKNPSLKRAIKEVAREVGEGKTISEALEKQQGFDKLYCSLIKAGETGGILDSILDKLAEHMEKQQKTIAQIKSALTYPVIVSLVGTGVIWAMLVFVVPQFTSMLTDTGQEIPGITKFVIGASDFLGDYAIFTFIGAFVAFAALKNYIKTPSGKLIYDKISMKMPVFGGIVIKGNLGSFSRTLSTMLSSGVSLVDALDICIETIDNLVITSDLKKVKKKVVEGKTLSEPLMKIDYFPDMVTQMIKVGEQTGAVDQMLLKVAQVFEDEVNDLVGQMTKMFEPIIIVVLGGIIAGILVAMYLPMFMSAGGA